METNSTPTVEALHSNGSIMNVVKGFDLRTMRLLSDSGYTHIRYATWGWDTLDNAIYQATPLSQVG